MFNVQLAEYPRYPKRQPLFALYLTICRTTRAPKACCCICKSLACKENNVGSVYNVFGQALNEIGDVNVTMHESSSREDGRGGRRWEISFTSLGSPSHVGEIQVKRGRCLTLLRASTKVGKYAH